MLAVYRAMLEQNENAEPGGMNSIATVDGKLVHVPKPEARVRSAGGYSNMVHRQRTI